MTFEEPRPSNRMGQWPRSTKEAVKSPALRQTVVEACNTVAGHVCQVKLCLLVCCHNNTPNLDVV